VWARGNGVVSSRARAVTRIGPQLGRRAATLFLFPFQHFPPLISLLNILCTKNYQK
jgi:hypothetical protein